MKKTLDRYFEEVAKGIECRMRLFVPASPGTGVAALHAEESMIVLLCWIPQPPAELLEPFLSEVTAGFREGVVKLGENYDLEIFSIIERHVLPSGERIGLILFASQPDKPHLWHPLDRDLLETLIGESLDAPQGVEEVAPMRFSGVASMSR